MLTYEQVELELKSQYPKGLHLEGYSHYSMQLKEFLMKLLPVSWGYGAQFNTFHGDELQCMKNKRRSQGDMWLIARTYYPNVTLREVRQTLLSIPSNWISMSYCSTVKKQVFRIEHPNNATYNWGDGNNGTDEYGWTRTNPN